jgi:hypothetical protein
MAVKSISRISKKKHRNLKMRRRSQTYTGSGVEMAVKSISKKKHRNLKMRRRRRMPVAETCVCWFPLKFKPCFMMNSVLP